MRGSLYSANCAQVVLPEIEKQPLEADSVEDMGNDKGLPASSSKRLKKVSLISTPVKPAEPKKRKIYIDDSESDATDDNSAGEVGASATPRKKESSESDVDIQDGLQKKQETERDG